jgi:hypothetical protein
MCGELVAVFLAAASGTNAALFVNHSLVADEVTGSTYE